MIRNNNITEKVAFVLVLLMTLLQGVYGLLAYVDPQHFADIRGTLLLSALDKDWVQIYGSRTLFITLVLGYLLFTRNFMILSWCAVFGMVMPITDGVLAYQSNAPFNVVLKHILTLVYLCITFGVLRHAITRPQPTS